MLRRALVYGLGIAAGVLLAVMLARRVAAAEGEVMVTGIEVRE